jgi:hypothetical protein
MKSKTSRDSKGSGYLCREKPIKFSVQTTNRSEFLSMPFVFLNKRLKLLLQPTDISRFIHPNNIPNAASKPSAWLDY